MKFDQDLCLKLQYDFGKMNSTLGSVVPLAMFKRCANTFYFSCDLKVLSCDSLMTSVEVGATENHEITFLEFSLSLNSFPPFLNVMKNCQTIIISNEICGVVR